MSLLTAPTPRWPVAFVGLADFLGVARGLVGYCLWLLVFAPFALAWCVGLNCLGWVLDKAGRHGP